MNSTEPRVGRRRREMGRADMIALVILVGLIGVGVIGQLLTRGERTMVADMVSDLQRFALHQESYRRDRAVYGSDLLDIQNRGFAKNPRVRFEIREATHMGWAATVSHDDTPVRCSLFVGDASPVGTASEPGVVACD